MHNIKLFICFSFLLICSSIQLALQADLKDSALVWAGLTTSIPSLKCLSMVCATVIGSLLIILSRYYRADRACMTFAILNAAIFLTYGMLGYSGFSFTDYPSILSIYYVWSSMGVILWPALIWGIASQTYTFKVAAIQYPLFAFLVFFSKYIALSLYLSSIDPQSTAFWDTRFPLPNMITSMLSLAMVPVFCWVNQKDSSETKISFPWGYVVALALLALGIKYATQISLVTFKFLVRTQFPTPTEYGNFMSEYSVNVETMRLFFTLIGIGLGLLIYWGRARALLLFSALLLILSACAGLVAFFPSEFSTLHKYAVLAGTGGLLATLGNLFYFGIPKEKRFAVNIAVALVVPLLMAPLTMLTQVIIAIQGSLLANPLVPATVFGGALLVSFVASLCTYKTLNKNIVG